MRYLKYFESNKTSQEKLIEYADDIVNVITTYYSNHTGDLCDQIDEILWNTSNVDLDGWENDGVLTEEMMRGVVEDYKGASNRLIDNLLDVYYDCISFVKLVNKDLVEDIKEVFLEYSDMGQVEVSKTSKFNDDRYSVIIRMKDIFFKINFEEVFGRIKELGFESYSVNGVKNGSLENMTIEFWKPLPKDEDDE
jgi:NTP pyrophosphatase (non-canonical NTP hydrolase)